jgi:hypothetical protein
MHRYLFLLLVTAGLWGQAPQGEIRLQIKDPSGAQMQAVGKVENKKAGVARDFQTDAQGVVVLGTLPPGRYRIEISKDGFVTQSVQLDVLSGAPVSRTVTMVLSGQAAKVDVISETPLAGTDLQMNQIAAPVQTATATDIQNSGALDLADFMNRQLNGVFINEMAGNPFQPDVNYRGYTASPLLGTP